LTVPFGRDADYTDMWKLIGPEINRHSRVSGTNQQAEQIYLFGLLTTGFFQSAIPSDTSIRCPFHVPVMFFVKRSEGRMGNRSPLGAISEEQFDKVFDVNVKGTLFTVQKALPLMRAGGSIILTGSTIGSMGRMCCNFVVELKVWVDDRKLSSSQRTDRE
jgi:hypothetical protein